MPRKSKVISEVKVQVVEEYLTGVKSMAQIAYELQINYSTIQDWVSKFKLFGSKGLVTENSNASYSSEIKRQAITDFHNNQGSLREICIRYNISSHSILRRWIKQYNYDKMLESCHTKGAAIMNNGRKTNYEERVEIVAFCISNNDNYQFTADKFKVSYQQVYTLVRKYKANGYEALMDRRGKRKEADELTDSDKLSVQLKLIESENRHLKMEIDFLKKFKEVERRR